MQLFHLLVFHCNASMYSNFFLFLLVIIIYELESRDDKLQHHVKNVKIEKNKPIDALSMERTFCK